MADRVGTASSGPQHGLGVFVSISAPIATVPLKARDLGARRFSALVVSPDPARRGQFVSLVHSRGAARVVECATGTEARARARIVSSADICLLDGGVQDVPVLQFVRDMASLGWRRVVLVTSRHDTYGVVAALGAGIRTYVVMAPAGGGSPSPTIRGHQGELTEREVEVLGAVADGMSNKLVGEHLGLSSLTVKSHLARIARKLGTGDRAEMVALAMRAGFIT